MSPATLTTYSAAVGQLARFLSAKGMPTSPAAITREHLEASITDLLRSAGWGASSQWADGELFEAVPRPDLEILDRIGGGDSFAAGLIYGFLGGKGPQEALIYGAAHGALAMTTPGDTSMATLDEVERLVQGGSPRVQR